MNLFLEIIKFVIYSLFIVIISKYILVITLRKLAENLNLKPKSVGNIAGYATSMPELLTIGVSSFNGLIDASIYNVISSNVINLIQYIFAIILNKNYKALRNKALIMDIVLVLITIFIPLFFIIFNININTNIVPAFIILYCLFILLNSSSHNLYLKNYEHEIIKEKQEKEKVLDRKGKIKALKYILYLLLTGVLLFIIGDKLGNTLEVLCNSFNVPQVIVGILLGFITSIPELITFFESQRHHKRKNNSISGVVEATNNLLTSNILNLFVIQSIGILIYIFI